MKICIISREYPPQNLIGGIGTYSYTAAQLLARKGHQITVITNDTLTSIQKEDDITVHRITMLPHALPPSPLFFQFRKWFRHNLPTYLDARTWSQTAAAYLTTILAQQTFDVIEYPETMGEGAFLKVKSKQTRLICRIHSSSVNHLIPHMLERFFIKKLQQKSCFLATKVVSPSQFVIDFYALSYLKLKNVYLSRNPICLWKKAIQWESKATTHLLYVGRIEHRKGLMTLLKAFKQLKNNNNPYKLRIIGSFPPPLSSMDKETQDLVKNDLIHNKENIEYYKQQPHQSMAQHYDWAGIFILPSLMENYPYVLLEALSRGAYTLGCDIGGIPEIINTSQRGLLFPKEDDKELAQLIRSCNQKESEIIQHAHSNVNEFKSHYTDEKNTLSIEKSYTIT